MLTKATCRTFVLWVTLTAVQAISAQTTYYVDGSCGDDSWTGTSRVCAAPDGPKRTVQAGLNAATSGDIVIVGDGVYTGAPVFEIQAGKDVTLRSENGAVNCRFEGTLPESVVGLVGRGVTAQTLISGFTFTNSGGVRVMGDARISSCVFVDNHRWGALLIEGNFPAGPTASPRISDCRFERNSATRRVGGAVSASHSNAVFEDCVFIGNETTNANGGAVNMSNVSSLRFIRCSFTANGVRISAAPRADGLGGAIYADFSTLTLEDCVFDRNTAEAKGGAVYSTRGFGFRASGCRFEGNTAVEFGGAIAARDGDRTIQGCAFVDNSSGLAGPGRGGAVWMDGSGSITILDCEFSGNQVGQAGTNENASGGALMIDTQTTPQSLLIERSRFVQNSALGPLGRGGAVDVSGARVIDSDFIGNVSGDPGAIFNGTSVRFFGGGLEMVRCQVVGNGRHGMSASGDSVRILDSVFVQNDLSALTVSPAVSGEITNSLFSKNGNSASQQYSLWTNANTIVTNCTIVDNESGLTAAVSLSGSVANTVVWGNNPATVNGGATYSYSCIEAGATGTGVISQDPRFVDPATGNYRLGSVSPGVDAGDNGAVPIGVTLDLDGNPRFVDDPGMPNSGVGQPPIVDMGAYERQESSCYADCDQSTGVGVLDIFDFLCFQNDFVGGGTYACDCDTSTGVGVCDVFDFLCFQNAFVSGCP